MAQWWVTVWLAAFLCIAGAGCDGSSGGGGGGGDGGGGTGTVALARAFGSRTFSSPVKLVQHPMDDNRWYVVEQGGMVETFLSTNTTEATVAVNVPMQAGVNLGGGEQGLLGMAFDPGFASSGEIYLAYTDAGNANRLVLERWVSNNGGLTFVPDAVVLTIPHTFANHNGSDIVFGPDGFLYYSTGDGGSGGDPEENAQDDTVLLGKILRLDVNAAPPPGKTYAIPSTNPFGANAQCNAGPGSAPCPEIFALGFRNPWRMNFDPATGKLYVGDVGQGGQEEIDLVTNGGNFGWDCLEGLLHFEFVPPCNTETFVEPELAYNDTAGQDSVTGGAVYRGSAIPSLVSFYIYTDFFRGPFFAFDVDIPDAPAQPLSASEANISAFGQGRDGEVYPVDRDGTIWKFVPGSG